MSRLTRASSSCLDPSRSLERRRTLPVMRGAHSATWSGPVSPAPSIRSTRSMTSCWGSRATRTSGRSRAPEVVYVLLTAEAAVEAVRSSGKVGVRLAIVCSSGLLRGSAESGLAAG